jgi:glycosyltransferase involved in cell wall biosynthesis
MRVTMVTQGSADNGSAYFRALQYAPLLAARGMETVLAPAAVARRRLPGRAGAALLLAEHTGRYAMRALELRRLLDSSDAVLVQRGAYPIGPPALLAALRAYRGRVVYDLDDATFLPTPTLAHRSRAARWMYEDRQARFMLDRADAVVVSTEELAAALPGRRAEVVMATIPDVWSYPEANHEERPPLRLGWIGSEGNVRYLEPLRDLFSRLARERVAELTLVGSSPWSGAAHFVPWSRGGEAAAVAAFEVGLMPLPDAPYTRAKAGFKLLQYMAAGCAVIASPVGINERLVRDASAGLLAGDEQEWESAIRELAADATRRRALGDDGRSFVREVADRERHADVLAALLRGEPTGPDPLLSRRSRG